MCKDMFEADLLLPSFLARDPYSSTIGAGILGVTFQMSL